MRQGQKRFGVADEAITRELLAIQGMKRLERMSIAILTAESWAELLATP